MGHAFRVPSFIGDDFQNLGPGWEGHASSWLHFANGRDEAWPANSEASKSREVTGISRAMFITSSGNIRTRHPELTQRLGEPTKRLGELTQPLGEFIQLFPGLTQRQTGLPLSFSGLTQPLGELAASSGEYTEP